MGVPKFYRWISERYPCLSEIIKEYQIPEYDNLYLDMNGIIHNCSHPNDDDPHFRISEEQILKDVFHYIEILFRLIQPRKLFFMAIDGVAPRAKMNQQRGRRFRSAREAQENEKKAKEKGEILPSEARFDSNCITPGTDFMAKLDAQLQYFVTSKMSNDKLWQNCTVIYSGHKTPGEGEHKIMEYIRFAKSKVNYDPNTRHCLYGLDADLIMLGLTSHEPHFSLLREEVRFGRKNDKSTKRIPTPEETTFHLLHLSLMREYIEYEFYDLHKTLNFPFDLEAIIDDWVMMGFLVGNDFIPNLPGLHINKDALPILYDCYKKVLPLIDGYLNVKGTLHLSRFEKFMEKLTEYDLDQFQEHSDNMKYIRSKKHEVDERMEHIKTFEFDDGMDDNQFGSLEDCPLDEREVTSTLARLGIKQDPEFILDDDDNSVEEESQFDGEFRQHKRHYYMTKMGFDEVTPQVLKDQAGGYIRGIQWILNYYYNGISSWEWYYPYHYAPYISDIKDFADIDVSFIKGKPFLPFEQLLAVLPPLSVKLLPITFSKLMLSESSPLIEFYPQNFQTDLNGKQQEWEAVVLIPFINENILLEEMKSYNDTLTQEEKCRNSHGPMFVYDYTPDILDIYKAPNYFPPVCINHALVKHIWREEWEMNSSDFIKGLLPGVRIDVYFAGFPTLKHIKHKFRIGKESIKVFQQPSRSDNIILEIAELSRPSWEEIINNFIGKEILVSWPHLVEAKVTAVSSKDERYYYDETGKVDEPIHAYLNKSQKDYFSLQVEDLKTRYHNRWGVDVGETHFLIYAREMSGRSYVAAHDSKITLEKHWAELIQPYPFQTIVRDICVNDPGYKQYKTVRDYFTNGSKVFMIGNPHYGSMGEVLDVDPEHKGRIRISMFVTQEPLLNNIMSHWRMSSETYMIGSQCSSRVGISPHLFARITGTVFLAPPIKFNPFQERETAKNKLNIGLNLKNNKKMEQVIGFTRKCTETKQWFYSDECIKVLQEYQEKFPEIFQFLHENVSKNDVFQDEVFPNNYKEKFKELSNWLKETPCASAERCKWDSVFLDPNIVDEIYDEVNKVSKLRSKVVKMQVKPYLLFKPNSLQGSTPPDSSVAFELFNRVINIREGYSVPVGMKGTIIGIHPAENDAKKLYDILFDEEFHGGMTLSGPKSKNRCYRLHWATIINISHGNKKIDITKQNSTYIRQDHHNKKEYINHPSPSNIKEPTESASYRNETDMDSQNLIVQVREQLPPNPSQLPPPFSFKSMLEASQKSKVIQSPKKTNDKLKNSMPINQSKVVVANKEKGREPRPSQEIKSETDVQFVIHGNFFSNWSRILERGLRKDDRNFIPCVTYVPPKIGVLSYQLHIYLDVRKLLQDGFKLQLLSEGQILCPTGSNGFLSPYYFEKVIDTENNCIIFPIRNQPLPAHYMEPQQHPTSMYGKNIGKGRGKIIDERIGTSNTFKMYENIWNQVQDLKSSQGTFDRGHHQQEFDNSPQAAMNVDVNREGRKELSLSELFRNAKMITSPKQNIGSNPSNDSSFVPTQVVRKQTPRKKTDSTQHRLTSEDYSFPIETNLASSNHQQRPPQKENNKANNNNTKAKKKSLSRIAANFPKN